MCIIVKNAFFRLLAFDQHTALDLFQDLKCSQEAEAHIIQFNCFTNSEQGSHIKVLM